MSHVTRCVRWAAACGALMLLAGCGENAFGPIQLNLGETALVVLVNPAVNSANAAPVPAPGAARANIALNLTGGRATITDASGVGVLTSVVPGVTTLSLSGGGSSGELPVTLEEGDIAEIAVAFGNGASEMARIQYALGGEVVSVTPTMTVEEVNTQLARSNVIVIFRSGTYVGNLEFAGSGVTLFGQGTTGGNVTINGNVTVTGSQNRMRGVRITGNLTVPASDFGMSFSRVEGAFQISGSGAVLLANGLCQGASISGSGSKLIGNAGLAPIPAPPDC